MDKEESHSTNQALPSTRDIPEVTPVNTLDISNGQIDTDVSPPASGKTAKKKNKAKGRNAIVCNDLDSELKKLTQRRINVAGAPKMPLNAYVRFMNDRREQLRREQPHRTALEHTKMIGEEWHQLANDLRAPYMESAARDKALYQEQMHQFLKEHPEIVANELAKAKKAIDNKNSSTPKDKSANSININIHNNNSTNEAPSNSIAAAQRKSNVKTPVGKLQNALTPDSDDIPLAHVKRTPTPTLTVLAPTSTLPPAPAPAPATVAAVNVSVSAPRSFVAGEIPIYTNEFIEHNRSTENELRVLRKTKTDLEQQNAVLEQHVDNTKAGHAKLMGEVAELIEENDRLMAYLKSLRHAIVTSLAGITLPSIEPSGLSVDNVDKYVQQLAGLISSAGPGAHQGSPMLLKVSDILAKIDTSGLSKLN